MESASPLDGTRDSVESVESLEDLYHQSPVGYFSATLDDVIVKVNGTFLAWTGYVEKEVLGRRFQEFLDPSTRLFYETRHVPVLRREGEVREVALRIHRADGALLPVLLNSVLVLDSDGAPMIVRSAVFDSTFRTQYEEALLAERQAAESAAARVRVLQNASATFASSSSALDLCEALNDIVRTALVAGESCVALLDDQGELDVIAGVNPLEGHVDRAGRRPGPDANTLDQPIVVMADDVETSYPAIVEGLRSAGLAALAVFPLVRNSAPLGAAAAFFTRKREIEQDSIDLVLSVSRQAAQTLARIRLQEQLAHLALHDQLTGLPNRALLRENLEQALATSARSTLPLVVMFLDLDGFKPVNDRLGHVIGDGVLQIVAARLRTAIRQMDVVGRFGGDEFVVVCQDIDREQAEAVAERLRSAVAEPFPELPPTFTISASIGVVVHNPSGDDTRSTDELLALADDEMYRAKNAGRNRVSVSED